MLNAGDLNTGRVPMQDLIALDTIVGETVEAPRSSAVNLHVACGMGQVAPEGPLPSPSSLDWHPVSHVLVVSYVVQSHSSKLGNAGTAVGLLASWEGLQTRWANNVLHAPLSGYCHWKTLTSATCGQQTSVSLSLVYETDYQLLPTSNWLVGSYKHQLAKGTSSKRDYALDLVTAPFTTLSVDETVEPCEWNLVDGTF